jgi:hypothetical protein
VCTAMKASHAATSGNLGFQTSDIITADECAYRLKVTRRALSNWPWMPRIKIGRSVRYIWPDVLITLKKRGAHTVTEEVGV